MQRSDSRWGPLTGELLAQSSGCFHALVMAVADGVFDPPGTGPLDGDEGS
ncbi:hypothetical protein AB0G87_39125 [Streptomyces asoensis]